MFKKSNNVTMLFFKLQNINYPRLNDKQQTAFDC